MYEWLIQNKDLIEIFASFAVAIALIFSAVALFLNSKAFRLQKQSFQADLFHKITGEINSLIDEQKACEAKGQEAVENWYVRLLAALEYYAFFANRNYFTSDMQIYYREAVAQYCEDIKDYPKLLEYLKDRTELEFCELEIYYEKHVKKRIPF